MGGNLIYNAYIRVWCTSTDGWELVIHTVLTSINVRVTAKIVSHRRELEEYWEAVQQTGLAARKAPCQHFLDVSL